jgi:hypothetical protein
LVLQLYPFRLFIPTFGAAPRQSFCRKQNAPLAKLVGQSRKLTGKAPCPPQNTGNRPALEMRALDRAPGLRRLRQAQPACAARAAREFSRPAGQILAPDAKAFDQRFVARLVLRLDVVEELPA